MRTMIADCTELKGQVLKTRSPFKRLAKFPLNVSIMNYITCDWKLQVSQFIHRFRCNIEIARDSLYPMTSLTDVKRDFINMKVRKTAPYFIYLFRANEVK